MNVRLTYVVPIIAICLGCTSSTATDKATTLEGLSEELTATKDSLKSLSEEVTEIRFELAKLHASQNRYQTAAFDPTEKAFSRIDTSIGSFAVSVQDVQPYADGVRVRLDVGNLGSATVIGGTFKVKWNSRMPEFGDGWAAKQAEWTKALREKEVKIADRLAPGTWNRVTLELPGFPPERFGHFELSIETNSISLIQPR